MAQKKKILIPVKANAYGHGIVEISQFLEKQKIDYLAVAFSSEGRQIREAGVKLPILVFNILDNPTDIIKYKLTPTIYSTKILTEIEKIAHFYKKKIAVHLNIDTGMGRIGINPENAEKLISKIITNPYLTLEGIYTHFASADNKKLSYTTLQLQKFTSLISKLKQKNITVPLLHTANSSAIVNYPNSYFNMVRPGIMIYGYSSTTSKIDSVNIKPALSLKTKIFHIKTVPAKTSIGYSNTYITKRKEIIATLPIGYGDGYNRLLSNKGRVIVQDSLCNVVGNISMDQTTIKLKSPSHIGTEVILIGKSKTKEITVEHMAKQLNTIPYEIVCNFNARIKRIYKE